MCFAWGEGFRAGAVLLERDFLHYPSLRCPHLLQELCWRHLGSTKDTLHPKKNLKLLLMVFSWAAPSPLN